MQSCLEWLFLLKDRHRSVWKGISLPLRSRKFVVCVDDICISSLNYQQKFHFATFDFRLSTSRIWLIMPFNAESTSKGN